MLIRLRWQFPQLLHRNIRNAYVLKNNILLTSSSCYCFSTKQVLDIRDENARVLFLGNDNFSLSCLRAIEEVVHSKECLSVVVSNRSNIVGKYATKKSISNFLWEDLKAKDNADVFDIGVVASFGHLIPKRIIEKCSLGILNVHGSLLPKYRGAAPISRAICNGDTETGVSIMKIAPHKFDVGPILIRRKCKIHPHVRSPELTKIMAEIGGEALKQVILSLKHSLDQDEPQRNEEATFAPKLTLDLAQVDWEVLTAVQVYNLFRGLAGFSKLFTYYGDKRIDLNDIGLVFPGQTDHIDDQECNSSERINEGTDFSSFYSYPVTATISSSQKIWSELSVPGHVSVYKNLIVVCCADKNLIFIRRVKLGSKWMTAKDFQNGYISKTKGLHMFLFKLENSANVHAIKTK